MVQTPSSTFSEFVQTYRQQVDVALAEYVEFDDDCPDRLRQAIHHSLLAPCKRLRPLLVLLAAEACGGEAAAALPAACAVEMIHTYSLIHDDLPAMDDDDLRRGRPSCHAAFDEATAILAGDALLPLAFETLARDIDSSTSAARCCAELAHAAGATALVGGQTDDLAAETSEKTLEQLHAIHRRKTGALISVSLRMGAIVADATAEQQAALEAYGQAVGLAFQITDDCLDLVGDEQAMGKRIGKDSDRGKLTFPGLMGLEESRTQAAALIEQACDALTIFAGKAEGLDALARYVLSRKH